MYKLIAAGVVGSAVAVGFWYRQQQKKRQQAMADALTQGALDTLEFSESWVRDSHDSATLEHAIHCLVMARTRFMFLEQWEAAWKATKLIMRAYEKLGEPACAEMAFRQYQNRHAVL